MSEFVTSNIVADVYDPMYIGDAMFVKLENGRDFSTVFHRFLAEQGIDSDYYIEISEMAEEDSKCREEINELHRKFHRYYKEVVITQKEIDDAVNMVKQKYPEYSIMVSVRAGDKAYIKREKPIKDPLAEKIEKLVKQGIPEEKAKEIVKFLGGA